MNVRKMMSSMVLAGALAAAVNVAAGGVAHAAQVTTSVKPAAGIFNPIKNVGNSMCLQPEGGSVGEVTIVQATCNGGVAQGWLFLPVSNGYHIVNQLSGLCMYMNGPVASRSPIAQVSCFSVSNELWKSSAPPPDVVTLMSRAGFRDTNLCIDVPGGAPTENLAVQILTCNGTLAQRWIIGFA